MKELDGFVKMTEIIQLLKQSSCYGNHDASYMLSIILSHGVGVRVDEITVSPPNLYGEWIGFEYSAQVAEWPWRHQTSDN